MAGVCRRKEQAEAGPRDLDLDVLERHRLVVDDREHLPLGDALGLAPRRGGRIAAILSPW